MKLKTLIIIILAIVVIAGIVFYFLSHNGPTPSTTPNETGSLPTTGSQQFPNQTNNQNATTSPTGTTASPLLNIVSKEPVLNYFIDNQNNAVIIQPSGTIEIVSNGTPSILSGTGVPNLTSALFSYDGKKILFTTTAATRIFDVATKSWFSLPDGIQNPVWSPFNYQIAYISQGSGGLETVVLGTFTGSSTKTAALQTLAMEDSVLAWPSKNTLIIADKPSAYGVGSALSFDLQAKTATPLIIEFPAMQSIWSGTTPLTGLIFSGGSKFQGGSLTLLAGINQKTLSFSTLTSKCTFNQESSLSAAQSNNTTTTSPKAAATTTLNLYCGVPRDQDTFSIARLPDEYDQKLFFTTDNFYEVNATTGNLTTIFSDPSQNFDATNLKVFNNQLFFINRYNQELYALNLSH